MDWDTLFGVLAAHQSSSQKQLLVCQEEMVIEDSVTEVWVVRLTAGLSPSPPGVPTDAASLGIVTIAPSSQGQS